jgi:excisionase family DNA binding protein
MQRRITPATGVQPDMKLLLSVEEAALVLSVGRTLLYDLVMRREIFSVKVGRSRRIPMSALQEFVGHLCEVQKEG